MIMDEIKTFNAINVIKSYQYAMGMVAPGSEFAIKQNSQTLEFNLPFWACKVDVE